MATITEDYVSFETAKLLKEKGFPQDPCICNTAYTTRGKLSNNAKSFAHNTAMLNELGLLPRTYSIAPTLQMAMKWLREVHNLLIIINKDANIFEGYKGYIFFIDYAKGKSYSHLGIGTTTNVYEDAVEAAIKYSLENLI